MSETSEIHVFGPPAQRMETIDAIERQSIKDGNGPLIALPESELSRLRRDSEALGRVRAWFDRNEPLVRGVDSTGDFWTHGFAAGYQSLSRAIADAGEES